MTMTYFSNTITYIFLKVAKTTMFLVTLIFALIMLSLESVAIRNSMHYVRNMAYDDIYLADEQLTVFQTKTEYICSVPCNQNEYCQSFSYNSLSMGCQHFLVVFWGRSVIGTNESGWIHYDPKALDCNELYGKQYNTGIYNIFPGNVPTFSVKCEMELDDGGWTIIQQRFDGTVDFNETWTEYKTGFGDLKGEFWLGNDKIHAITTSADYELRVDMSDWHGNSWYAVYKTFMVGDENSQFMLTIGNYSGNAGDSMSWHDGMSFSTMDRDNDMYGGSCANEYGGDGGWWYNVCDFFNLNSVYGEDIGDKMGIEWETASGKNFTMKTTRMMIRPL